MAFREVWGLRKTEWQQLYTIQQQDLTIKSLRKSLAATAASDSICTVSLLVKDSIIDVRNKQLFNTENLYIDAQQKNRNAKATKWGLGVSMPVVAVLAFVLGFYLHR